MQGLDTKLEALELLILDAVRNSPKALPGPLAYGFFEDIFAHEARHVDVPAHVLEDGSGRLRLDSIVPVVALQQLA
ncbi:hypothetical protein D3C87_1817120 [compost metagenome]